MASRHALKNRKNVARFPCGKAKPQELEINWPVIIQRAIKLSLPLPHDVNEHQIWLELASGKNSSFAIGAMLLRGMIEQREYDAAIKYEEISLRWQTLSGAPSRNAGTANIGVIRGSAPIKDSEKEWDYIDRERSKIAQIIRSKCKKSMFIIAAIESVVIDGIMPPEHVLPMAISALKEGLSVLADFFVIA